MDKFGGIKENVEVVRSFDWWTVVIGVLIAIGIVMLCVKIKDFVVSTFGITTKSALAKQAQEERIKDLNNQIIDLQKEVQQFKDNRTHDRDQSFDIQKQLTDSQTLLQNSVENLRKMLVNKEINDMRWEILDFSNAVMNGRVYNKEIYSILCAVQSCFFLRSCLCSDNQPGGSGFSSDFTDTYEDVVCGKCVFNYA